MSMQKRAKPKQIKKGAPPWMTTYADMVTLLFAFFVLLYSFSSLDVQKFQAFISSFNASVGILDGGKTVSSTPSIGAARVERSVLENDWDDSQELQAVYDTLLDLVEAGDLPQDTEIRLEKRGLVVRFANQAFFELGSANLQPSAETALNKIAEVLIGNDLQTRIEGHTDNLPIANNAYASNWELSTARAISVIRFLTKSGSIPPHRLSAAGYGEFRSIASNDTTVGREKNRRVDIVVLRAGLSELEPEALGAGENL